MSEFTAMLVWGGAVGVLSGLVSSGVFLLVLSLVKPRIDISPEICRTAVAREEPAYYVKLVNRTRWPVANVKFLMTFATSTNVPGGAVSGGPIFLNEPIELRTQEILTIRKFSKKDPDQRYALRLKIKTNLGDAWQNEEAVHVRFQVYATHSLTGFGKVFEKKYYGKSATSKDGTFQRGDSFEIVPM